MKKLVIHPKDRTTDFLKPIYHGRNDVTVLTGGCSKDEVNEAIDKHDHIIMLGHGTPQGLLAMNQFNKRVIKPLPPVVRQGVTPAPKTYADVSKVQADYQQSRKTNIWTDDDDLYGSGPISSGYSTYGTAPKTDWHTQMTTGYVVDDDTVGHLMLKKTTAIWCNADQYMEWNGLEGFYTGMFISDTSEAAMIGTADTAQWQVEESNYGFVSVVRRFLDHDSEKLHAAVMMEYGEMADRNAVAKYNLKRMYTRKADDIREARTAS